MARATNPSSSFTLLQRLAASFDLVARGPLTEKHERTVKRLADGLGATALPMCVRQLKEASDERAAWAYALLAHLAEGTTRDRVVEALRAVATGTDSNDQCKLRALALLCELNETVAGVTLNNPARARRDSMMRLASSLSSHADVARAAELITDQFTAEELGGFLRDLGEATPPSALAIARELLLRDDVATPARTEIEALVSSIETKDSLQPIPGRVRTKIGNHGNGHTLLVAIRRNPKIERRRYRMLCLLCSPEGCLVDCRYRDDLSTYAANSIIEEYGDHGFVFHDAPLGETADIASAAVQRLAHQLRQVPRDYYLGRDLLGLTDEHLSREQRSTSAEDILERAENLVAAGRYLEAKPLFERYLDLKPDDAAAWSELGLCCMRTGDLLRAEVELSRAANLEPGNPDHLWNLAAVAQREDCPGGCYIGLTAFVVKIGSDDPRWQRATRYIADYERDARLHHPECDPLSVALAEKDRHSAKQHLGAGNFRSAIRSLEHAISLVPTLSEAWSDLGEIHLRLGQYLNASRHLDRALELNPCLASAKRAKATLARIG